MSVRDATDDRSGTRMIGYAMRVGRLLAFWLVGWLVGSMDGWLFGWRDGWMDGWTNERAHEQRMGTLRQPNSSHNAN